MTVEDMDTRWSLAIETSCSVGSVALSKGGDLVAEQSFSAGLRHGVELLPAIDGLLKKAGVRAGQIGVAFVSAGPGSFTGLRVGFTFARALAQVHSVRLVPVPTCDVIVENLRGAFSDRPAELHLAAILDAKRRQIYTAGFRWDGKRVERLLTERVMFPAELLAGLPRPLWLVGEGIDYHRDDLKGEGVEVVAKEYWRPRAANVLKLGLVLAASGQFVDYNTLVPTYIRLPEAEERRRAGRLTGRS